MEQARRLKMMTRLAAAFPRDNVRQSTVTLYATETAKLDVELLEQVVENAIVGATKFPTIADIRTDYRHALERVPPKHAALPIGRPPIPESYYRAKEAALLGKFDERAQELESEDA